MTTQTISTGTYAVPPGPRGYPLIGVLPMLARNPLRFLSNVAAQYGDVVSLRVGPQRFYLINHPDHAKYILQERHRNYQKGANLAMLKQLLGEGLATSEGDFWLRQRRLVQPAFHHERIARMASAMTDAAEATLQRWDKLARPTSQLEVVEEMMRLTQEIIVKTMFSSGMGDDTEVVYRSLNVIFAYLGRLLWTSMLPSWLIPGQRQFEQALGRLDEVVYRIIDERRRSGEDPGDLLTMLLEVRDEETGESMSDKQVRDEVMTIFLAGQETIANSLAWVWHLLAEHPEAERKLHAELAEVLGGRTPTFQDVPQLKYTRRVVEESMRLYPSGWALFRTPLADDVVGGYSIPAGSVVILSPYVLHRTAAFWENPDQFDPERFSPERSAGRSRYTYLPFSGGPRQCIGNTFAMMEAQLIVATIAQRYLLRSVPGHRVEPKVAVLLHPRHGIRMELQPRNSGI